MSGWLKLHRKSAESRYYSMGLKHIGMFKVIMLKANWKIGYFQGHEIHPGSFATSISGLAESLCEDRRTVRKLLDDLEKFGMISRKSFANRWTHITICNWEVYQGSDDAVVPTDVHQSDQPVSTDMSTGMTTIEEVKKERRVEGKKKPKVHVEDKSPTPEPQGDHKLTLGPSMIQNWWNGLATESGFPKIQTMTPKRAKAVKARKFDDDLTEKIQYAVSKSMKFLSDGSWFSFDWILSENNLTKLIEGNYYDSRGAGATAGRSGRVSDWDSETTQKQSSKFDGVGDRWRDD